MDYQALFDELTNDPLSRGYAGMTDAEAADDLNTEYRTRNRASMSGDEVFGATDPAEFNALDTGSGNTPDVQGHWIAFCGRDNIDPFGSANVAFVQSVFGAGSTTVSNLAALRTETVSRAVELGLGAVTAGDVIKARAYPAGE